MFSLNHSHGCSTRLRVTSPLMNASLERRACYEYVSERRDVKITLTCSSSVVASSFGWRPGKWCIKNTAQCIANKKLPYHSASTVTWRYRTQCVKCICKREIKILTSDPCEIKGWSYHKRRLQTAYAFPTHVIMRQHWANNNSYVCKTIDEATVGL